MSGLADATIRATASCAGKTLTSLLVRIRELAVSMDDFETPATPDPRIVLLLNKTAFIEQFSEGKWRGTHYRKGTGFIHAPGSRCEFPPVRRPSK
jgi:hypothetical protein